MALFQLQITATYQCRNAKGQFAPSQTLNLPLQVEGSSELSNFDDEIQAEINANAPDNCVNVAGYSYTIEQLPVGGNITVYARAIYDCGDKKKKYRTVRVDVPVTMTKEEVWDTIRNAIADLGDDPDTVYACDYVGFIVEAPLLYAYSGL